MKDKFVPVF